MVGDSWGHAEALIPTDLSSATPAHTNLLRSHWRTTVKQQQQKKTYLSGMPLDIWWKTQLWCTGTRQWFSAVKTSEKNYVSDCEVSSCDKYKKETQRRNSVNIKQLGFKHPIMPIQTFWIYFLKKLNQGNYGNNFLKGSEQLMVEFIHQ